MAIVEHHFFDETEYDQFEDNPMECWQFRSEATTTPLHRQKSQVHERHGDYDLVEQDQQNRRQ